MTKLISATEILDLIPQRPPILMIDGVCAYTKGSSIITSKRVDENSAAFKGHFPDFPLLPGVLLIEAAAQTGAIMMRLEELDWQIGTKINTTLAPKKIGVLGGSKVRFKKPVFPNTEFFVHGTIDWYKHGSMALKVKVMSAEKEVFMSGSVTLSTTLKSNLEKVNSKNYVPNRI